MKLLEAYSPLPPLEAVLKSLKEQAAPETVSQALAELERQLAMLQGHFNVELQYLETSPTLTDTLPTIQSSFHRSAEYLENLRQLLEQDQRSEAESLLEGKFRKRVGRLVQAFQRLQEEEEQREKLCRSPVYEPLLRAVAGLFEGRLGPQLVLERLTPLIEQEETFLLSFAQLKSKAGEEAVLAEQGDEIFQSVEELLETLLDMEAFLLEDLDEESLEGVEECASAVAELVEGLQQVGDELTRAREKLQYQTCPRCGHQNEATFKVCGRCGGAIPQYATNDKLLFGSELDFKTEEPESPTGPEGRPELFARLIETLEGFLREEVVQDVAERELSATETRLRAVQSRLSRSKSQSSPEEADFQATLEQHLEQYSKSLADFGLNPCRQCLDAIIHSGDALAHLMGEMNVS